MSVPSVRGDRVRHAEQSGLVQAPVDHVFAHLDDQARLSAHMDRSSWMMGGGRMEISTDSGRGQRVGSIIRLAGRAFGLRLSVEETVVRHEPPHTKEWETVGTPRLLVIGPYRMGFWLTPRGDQSELRVWIDYALPARGAPRLLGYVFSKYYARWCTQRMVADAVAHFGSRESLRPLQAAARARSGS